MKPQNAAILGLGGLVVLGLVLAVAGGGTKPAPLPKPPAPKPAPEPAPKPAPEPPPQPEPQAKPPNPGVVPSGPVPDPTKLPGLVIVDNRAKAPADYIRRQRAPSDIRAIVLHQTGFQWKPDNPMWPKVRAHFVVRRDGVVLCNFDPIQQMRYGSSFANPFCITIEHEGNYPSAAGEWYEPEKFGKDRLEEAPAQVAASRKLVAALRQAYPSITHVYAHRQWQEKKSNCPGPDVWRAVGEWAKQTLALTDGGPGWHYDGGLPLPDTWLVPWPKELA